MTKLFGASSERIQFHLMNLYRDKEQAKEAVTKDALVARKRRTRLVLFGLCAAFSLNITLGTRGSSRHTTMS